MKQRSIFVLVAGLLMASNQVHAIDLNPTLPLEYRNNLEKIVEVVCKYDEDELWTIRLPEGDSKFIPESPQSLLIKPAVPNSSIRVTLAKLDGLPADFEAKESLAFYDAIVRKNVPSEATTVGPLKRSGPFGASDATPSDSFGLVYTLHAQEYAVACGFLNLKELGVQLRYTLFAPVKNFEELHRYIRYELRQPRRTTEKDVRKLSGTTLPE